MRNIPVVECNTAVAPIREGTSFLSSISGLTRGQQAERRGLRWEAWCDAGAHKGKLFVAEFDWEAFTDATHAHIEIATKILEQVRRSDRFVCMLHSDKSGSALAVHQQSLATTFFELEIFQAIVLSKPFYLVVHASFDVEALSPYIDVLDICLPEWRDRARERVDDKKTLAAIRQIVRGQGLQWKVKSPGRLSPHAHMELLRSRDQHVNGGTLPCAHFMRLGHDIRTSPCEPNLNAISELLTSRRFLDDEQDNDRRLVLSWMLARELMAGPLLDLDGNVIQREPIALAGWNAAMVDWHSAASWHGLHSHIYFGTVPTVNTLEVVRQTIRASQDVDSVGGSVERPRGLYSTSYYSIAKRVPYGNRSEVLDLASKALFVGKPEKDVLADPRDLNMLGSIAFADQKTSDALALFQRSLSILRASHATPPEIGMVICELAFVRMATGSASQAAGDARGGLEMMRRTDQNGCPVVDGFLARALFKSAAIHVRAGQVGSALAMYWEAYKSSERNRLDDQLTQWGPKAIMKRATDKAAWTQVLRELGLA